MKLGLEGQPLTALEKKVLRAAATTHLETGLTIGAHTGFWEEVEPGVKAQTAIEQIAMLEQMGVSPSAWIWIHAHDERKRESHIEAADAEPGWLPSGPDGRLCRHDWPDAGCRSARTRARFAGRRLVHRAAQPNGGDFNPFHPIFTSLIPALRRSVSAQA